MVFKAEFNPSTEKLLFCQLSDFLSLKSDRYKYFLSSRSLNLRDGSRLVPLL